jgi:phosphatidate cytidylyltransferase
VLQTRLKTAALLLPAVLAIVIFAPPALFSGFIAFVSLWSLYEIGAMLPEVAGRASLLLLCCAISLALLATQGPTLSSIRMPLVLAVTLVTLGMLGLVARVGVSGADSVAPSTILMIIAGLWVGALDPYFAYLRNGFNGVAYIILVILLVVASDSGAYFVGRSIGRVKLIPRVSPNKTVEGALGGLVTVIATGLILRPWLTPSLRPRRMLVLAIAVGILAQLGDLANSALKRIAGVKDSGWIFPGHGGLLDRTCSLVFPAVFAYYYLHLPPLVG